MAHSIAQAIASCDHRRLAAPRQRERPCEPYAAPLVLVPGRPASDDGLVAISAAWAPPASGRRAHTYAAVACAIECILHIVVPSNRARERGCR